MNKIVVANMKMNMTIDEIKSYLEVINKEISTNKFIICPTSIYIPYFLKKSYKVGIQNVYYEKEGAFTGEVSPYQASLMGINYAIVGHSERRQIFLEKDDLIAKKVKESIKNNLGTILCIGETNEEKELLKTNRVLKRQITNAIRDLDKEMLNNLVIAYEPIWAIGTGKIPSNKDIKSIASYIKMIVKECINYDDIPVLYGGSVNEKNIKELNKIDNIKGFLVGGASNDAKKITKIVDEVIK